MNGKAKLKDRLGTLEGLRFEVSRLTKFGLDPVCERRLAPVLGLSLIHI